MNKLMTITGVISLTVATFLAFVLKSVPAIALVVVIWLAYFTVSILRHYMAILNAFHNGDSGVGTEDDVS